MAWITTLCATIIIATSLFGSNGYISRPLELFVKQLQIILDTIKSNPNPNPPLHISLENIEKEYDFIIVGGGTAGCVVANRLSEIGRWKVLLLEAGYLENNLSQYPTLAATLQFTDYNWGFTTEPQDNFCLAMDDQRCSWPRGRALGGSSSINYMLYMRGNPDDYNRWAAQGNPGWSYEDVLPYFLKSENAQKMPFSDPKYHNVGGYQSVEQAFLSNLTNAFIRAGQELGYPLTDYNSPQQIGFSPMQTTTRLGRRASTATSYLQPILNRENLDILMGARVTKILIDPDTNEAYGVEYIRNDRKSIVTANKEVILSAGTLQTPQLLMLSGIGPQEELEEHRIKTLSDLPVGKALYDHVIFIGLLFNTNFTFTSLGDTFSYDGIQRWFKTGQSGISSIGNEALACIKSNKSSPLDGASPDYEIILSPGITLPRDYGVIGSRSYRISREYYEEMYGPLEGMSQFALIPVLFHPRSVGYMKLKSADPYDDPLFYANYLSDPENHDIRILIEAIRFAIRLSETEAFRKYDVRLNEKPILGCEHLEYNSDDYWYCALQFLAVSAYHQTGTCKMGPNNDPTVVVNNELKVYGVRSLRIIDASVIPTTIAAHTNAPTILVAEVGSDIIKSNWGVM